MERIATLLQLLKAEGIPKELIKEIAHRPGPNRNEVEKEAG